MTRRITRMEILIKELDKFEVFADRLSEEFRQASETIAATAPAFEKLGKAMRLRPPGYPKEK